MDYLERIREIHRSGDTESELGQAVANIMRPIAIGEGDKFHYESVLGLASAIRQVLSLIDPSISPDLPAFLLEPANLTRAFGLPLEKFNCRGPAPDGDVEGKLDKILANTELLVEREPDAKQEDDPSFTVPQVAQKLQVSQTKVYQLTESGKLKNYKTGNQIRIKASHIREYQAQHTRTVVDTKRRRSGSFNKSEADRLFGPGWDA
jgi:excisionase family DNA binding protein